MTEFTELPIKQLHRTAIDWAVAHALGYELQQVSPKVYAVTLPNGRRKFISVFAALEDSWSPSRKWEDLGPVLETIDIVLANHAAKPADLDSEAEDSWGSAHCYVSPTSHDTYAGIRIAACRAIVSQARVLKSSYKDNVTVYPIPNDML